jgi:hypothetical protein
MKYKLSESEIEKLQNIGAKRYGSKRAVGISSTRSDGSVCTAENDIESSAAEFVVGKHLECPFNDEIYTHGDGGVDLVLELKVDAVWLGVNKAGKPRQTGHLIVNPHEPQRWSDIYVVVKGSIEEGFEIVGWTTHSKLTSLPQKDFGYGERFAMHIDKLFKSDLRKIKR